MDQVEAQAYAAGDPLDQLEAAIASLAAEDRSHWPTPTLSDRVVGVLELRERLDAAVLSLVAEWNRRRAWEADAALSPVSWLEHRVPVSGQQARSLVKTARLVDAHPALSESLRDGDITTPHVEVVARAVSKGREPLLEGRVDELSDHAARLSVRDFTTLMRRWAALADDLLATEDYTKKWERRHLHASVTMDGWVSGDFFLDPAAGQSFISTLDHLAPPDPIDVAGGPRSLSQRRADALVDLTRHYLDGGRPAANPPNIDVIVDVTTLTGDTPELAQIRCDLDGVGPVTRATLEQAACSANVTRIVTAGDSVVLDMGRKVRIATAAQRRAVARRDQLCIAPGCDRPHWWCDVHHIAPWAGGGATDLDNLVLLCRRHHTLVHNTKWTVRRNGVGTFTLAHPARGP